MYLNAFLFFSLLKIVCSGTTTVTELDISKYLGFWYQVYGAPFDFTFQGYGKCISAYYEILSDTNISVFNSQLSRKNELQTISGYGYYENKNEPGKLMVHLEGTPKDAPYWIVKLGEIVEGQYQYSVVTTPSEFSLWVLARNVDVFSEKYQSEVLAYLDANHFRYVPIQQSQCIDDNDVG